MGTVHVDNTSEGIRQGILEMKNRFVEYEFGIHELQAGQKAEWEEKVRELAAVIRSDNEAQERDDHLSVSKENRPFIERGD
jgi:hypothetical protein